MGARKGTITFTKFHVDGAGMGAVNGKAPDRAELVERLREFRWVELTAESEEDLSHGWVEFDNAEGTAFTIDNTHLGEYVCLGFRVDRWRLPKPVVDAKVSARLAELKKETGQQKLFRSQKAAVTEEVHRALRKKSMPATVVIDVVYATERAEVRVWAQGPRILELFESLWESSFGLRLVPDGPYIRALGAQLDPLLVGRLSDVEQARFVEFQ